MSLIGKAADCDLSLRCASENDYSFIGSSEQKDGNFPSDKPPSKSIL